MTNTTFSTSINFVNLDEDGILVCDNAIVSLGNIRGTTRAESEAAAISTFEVNEEKLGEALHRNPILVTALNPIIGYEKAAEIAKRAYREGRPIVDIAEEETDISREELIVLLDPQKLTEGGL